MNTLEFPPIRDPFLSGLSEPAINAKNWQQWFSNLQVLINQLQATGTTIQRPNPAPFVGFPYFDTTLGIPIWAKTLTVWVNATGAPV